MVINVNKYVRFLVDADFRFGIMARRGFYDHMPDETYLKKRYQSRFHRELDLQNPQTFNEKLQWLKLYDRNPLYTTLVDKYAVRGYIADKLGEEYLIPLVGGPWKDFDEIDFDQLPNQFVLKCTHDSGGVVVCRDKSQLDIAKARKKLKNCLKRNYYYNGREWPYKNVPPQMIAEKYMEDESCVGLKDYKFMCFNGVPKAILIVSDRAVSGRETRYDFFDMEFEHLPFSNGHPNAEVPPECPLNFEEMKELAAKLSEGIPQVRVDLYDVGGRIYFGELTFFRGSGFMPFDPPEWDNILGEWITLPDSSVD